MFKLITNYEPSGDQPKAIKELVNGIKEVNKPTLILAHNKTLARQLYSEFKELFPEAAVSYFISYYSDTPKTLIFRDI